jgi:hypothetical protein
VGRRVGVHQGRWSRWPEETPKWDVLFRFLVLRRVDFFDVFPETEKVLVRGVRRTLHFIDSYPEEKVPGEPVRHGPIPHAHPVLWDYLVKALVKCPAPRSESVLRSVLQEVVGRSSTSGPVTVELLRQCYGRWIVAWLLLLDSLPEETIEDSVPDEAGVK